MSFFFTPPSSDADTPRLRTFWRFAIFSTGVMAIFLVVNIFVAIAAMVFLSVTGHPPELRAAVLSGFLLQAVTAIPLTGLTFGLCWLCRRYLDRRPMSSMGLVRPAQKTSGVVAGFFFGLTPIVIAVGILCFIGGFRFERVAFSIQMAYMAPALVLFAFHEEIVFRGYLLQNFFDIRRHVFGFLVCSVAFWLIHGLNPSVWSSPIIGVNLFGAGVMLGLAYQFSGNIWFPTAAHFGWNFAQGVLFDIPVSGMSLEGLIRLKPNDTMTALTGGDFGLEGSIVTTVLLAGMIAMLLYGIRSRKSKLEAQVEAVSLESASRTDSSDDPSPLDPASL